MNPWTIATLEDSSNSTITSSIAVVSIKLSLTTTTHPCSSTLVANSNPHRLRRQVPTGATNNSDWLRVAVQANGIIMALIRPRRKNSQRRR